MEGESEGEGEGNLFEDLLAGRRLLSDPDKQWLLATGCLPAISSGAEREPAHQVPCSRGGRRHGGHTAQQQQQQQQPEPSQAQGQAGALASDGSDPDEQEEEGEQEEEEEEEEGASDDEYPLQEEDWEGWAQQPRQLTKQQVRAMPCGCSCCHTFT
jgi:hypothetical protein